MTKPTRHRSKAPTLAPAAELGVPLAADSAPPFEPATQTKLGLLISLLQRSEGATVAQLAEATGWQVHSVRGAMAGALKKRGHVVSSETTEAGRVYRLPRVDEPQG